MTEAFCAPETEAAGYSVCKSTHRGCSNLKRPPSSWEAEEQKQRWPQATAVPSSWNCTFWGTAENNSRLIVRQPGMKLGRTKSLHSKSLLRRHQKQPGIAALPQAAIACCNTSIRTRKREMAQLPTIFIPALVLNNVISPLQHCLWITPRKQAVSPSWHTELIKIWVLILGSSQTVRAITWGLLIRGRGLNK